MSYYDNKRKDVFELIKGRTDISKFLDVGCGSGVFGALIKQNYNAEVWGVEPVISEASQAIQLIDKVLYGFYESVMNELPDLYFDGISFNDSLEHMINPEVVLLNAKSKLSINGRVYASIPNFLFADNIKSIIINHDFKYADSGILDRSHLRFFTEKSIIRLFNELGYDIEKIRPLNLLNSKKWNCLKFLFCGLINDFLPMQYGVVAVIKR